MNNELLAKRFVAGCTKLKGNNMFIEGDTIYSYGTHYPIAKRYKQNVYLFNTEVSSSSTARHKRYVYRALVDKIVIEIYKCNPLNAHEQIQANNNKVKLTESKLGRARTESNKAYYKDRIKFFNEQNLLILNYIIGDNNGR